MSGAFPLPHPYIVGEHQPDSFEDRTQQNFDALAIAIGSLSARIGGGHRGPIADRPASGIPGRRYYATDVGLEFVDHGTGWAPVGIPLGGFVDIAWEGDVSEELVVADGRALPRTGTFAPLFALLGTTFGPGDGSTTFNLPDARGRVPIAAGQGPGLTARSLGAVFGAETHTLTVAEMPSHNHGGTTSVAGEHNHQAGDRKYNGASGTAIAYLDVVSSGGQPWGTGWAGDHSHTISSQGGGQPHNNMQPSIVVRRLIRIK